MQYSINRPLGQYYLKSILQTITFYLLVYIDYVVFS